MFASTSGRSMLGLRIEPRSPPVHVTTWTSTPSATYLAVVAAPLLDSSSGWAWTCIRRSMTAILGWGGESPDARSDRAVRRPVASEPAAGRHGHGRGRGARAGVAGLGDGVPLDADGVLQAGQLRRRWRARRHRPVQRRA